MNSRTRRSRVAQVASSTDELEGKSSDSEGSAQFGLRGPDISNIGIFIGVRGLSQGAILTLQDVVQDVTEIMLTSADKERRMLRLDEICSRNIIVARHQLSSKVSRWSQFGGVLLGCGSTAALTMLNTGRFSAVLLVTAVVGVGLGAWLMQG